MRRIHQVVVLISCLLICASSANAILNVPLYGQCDSPWGDDTYDSSSRTVCDIGCAMTSCTMVLRYYGVTKGPSGQDVNPGTINAWLKKNHGYVGTSVDWFAIARFSQLAKSQNNNNSVKFVGRIQKSKTSTQSIVDGDLAAGKPVILNVKNSGHFVVCTGKSGTVYSMNDPMRYSNSLLYYSNTWQGIRRFARASGPSQLLMMEESGDEDYSGIGVWGNAWVDICLTDSQGLSTGIDPVSHQEVNEIPNSNYGLEKALTDELWGDPVGNDWKFADVITPASSSYELKVFSVAGSSGPYTIHVYSLDSDANYCYREISGNLVSGQTDEYTIVQPASHTISIAKSFLGVEFELRGKVVTSASNSAAGMYIQEPNGSAGIRVIPDPNDPDLPYLAGDIVDVSGTVQVADGELQIQASEIAPQIREGADPKPKGIVNRDLGGSALGSQPEVTGTHGLNNVGLLMKIWGSVTAVVGDYFYVDDGSGLLDGSGSQGVRVAAPGLTKPDEGDYVAVTGISSVAVIGGNSVRLLKARSQSDIDVISQAGGGLMAMQVSISDFTSATESAISTIFKPWPGPTAEEILGSSSFIRDDSQVGAKALSVSMTNAQVSAFSKSPKSASESLAPVLSVT